jgi:hypothetical protein
VPELSPRDTKFTGAAAIRRNASSTFFVSLTWAGSSGWTDDDEAVEGELLVAPIRMLRDVFRFRFGRVTDHEIDDAVLQHLECAAASRCVHVHGRAAEMGKQRFEEAGVLDAGGGGDVERPRVLRRRGACRQEPGQRNKLRQSTTVASYRLNTD